MPIGELLGPLVEKGTSDLQLTVPNFPMPRVDGEQISLKIFHPFQLQVSNLPWNGLRDFR
jgi:hypothetical protein